VIKVQISNKIILIGIILLIFISINIHTFAFELDFGNITAKEEIEKEEYLLLNYNVEILELWIENELKNEKGDTISLKRINLVTRDKLLSFANNKIIINKKKLMKENMNVILSIKIKISPSDHPGLYKTNMYIKKDNSVETIPIKVKINPWVNLKNLGVPKIKQVRYDSNYLYSSGENILQISSNTNWILYMKKREKKTELKLKFMTKPQSKDLIQVITNEYFNINKEAKVVMKGKKTTNQDNIWLSTPYNLIIENYKELPAGFTKIPILFDLKIDEKMNF